MKVAIPREKRIFEKRVALVPAMVKELINLGCDVLLERDAGLAANYPDHQYEKVHFYSDTKDLYQNADIILKVQPPLEDEIILFKKNCILVSFMFPALYANCVTLLKNHYITSFAIESIPRISRAQSMDALSSQATVSGYKAVLLAANLSRRFFPMLTTAAGTIKPASVLVIGAGVAGLQAIATAKRLGAIVSAYDIRPAAREQVESLGAKMIQIDLKADAAGGYARELTSGEILLQQHVLTNAIAKADIVISTALIPGKSAPRIITKEMVEKMGPGSLIIDIAAEMGGNCELTQVNQTVEHFGVTIFGPINLPSMVPYDASFMYSKNLIHFLKLFFHDSKLSIDWDDPILAQSIVTHEGFIKDEVIRKRLEETAPCLSN